jgi:hypothetical protein
MPRCIETGLRPTLKIDGVIDAASDPGSWARHLRHTAAMRGGDSDSS